MVLTDSIKLYEDACRNGKQISGGRDAYYVQIIATMFYELITKKMSPLLSLLCAVNNIRVDVVNYSLQYQYCNYKSTYDLLPLVIGLNAAFVKDLNECNRLFSVLKYGEDIFQGKIFHKNFDYQSVVSDELRSLDKNIAYVLLSTSVSDKPKRKEEPPEPKKVKVPDTILRIHDPKLSNKLNKLAEIRTASDSAIYEQIQQLQVSLQEELKQIMKIREGIDYNITQEAINQFIFLFSLLSETLQYHPNDESNDSYHNLVESCEDFLENIKQSLTLLGVTIINDVGSPFDAEKHKAAYGVQPRRSATIAKVVKIGFAYKNKVLEKAEVELA